ncbi:MAG: nucleoside 2-deoxyribosyltransferase [Methanomicrobiaceae archaeon]|nr:nucleoside 2-deoxyribosyltransferase [Methanomicrobiaceae archaeon]
MYVLLCPCILDPGLRARGITRQSDLDCFSRCLERCRHFGIETVPLPCPETMYLGPDRAPGSFEERLETPAFARLLDRCEEEVQAHIARHGDPLSIVGVDSSPVCGVTSTYRTDEREPGRGAFLSRFPEQKAMEVKDFARYKVYLAAPLFSEAEQMYNRALQDDLSAHFFEVYLPQEVGDTSHTREKDEHTAIFAQHIAALDEADMVVAVVDGADADSGTSWEMGYAFARRKPVISLRTDFRCAGHHELVNLMLEESSIVVTDRTVLPAALQSPRIRER